ncbi:MAG: hypothetical protein R3E01_04230 [Pirellulaceae bacterium]
MNDFGLFTWDPTTLGPLIVHWKEDLPYIVICAFWFSVMGCYIYFQDRKTKKQRQQTNQQLKRRQLTHVTRPR